jgi:hypothetical protein
VAISAESQIDDLRSLVETDQIGRRRQETRAKPITDAPLQKALWPPLCEENHFPAEPPAMVESF